MIEEAIDPALPVCDPHHHLWDGPGERGRYLLDEYLEDAGSGHKVAKTVFVECGAMYKKDGPQQMRPIGETEFAEAMGAQTPSGQDGTTAVAAGIIGFADLTLGASVTSVIEAHLAAGKSRFRGIRQSCTWDSDRTILTMGKSKGMMLDAKFREGFACLRQYGLSFDAWQYFTQLMELADLARAFPDTPIIVNHTGGILGIGPYAGKRDESFREWKRGVMELASCPNVMMKLGGLGMPRCGFGWHEQVKPASSTELAAAMAPYYRFCIEVFGPERCMFESNFPVDKVSYSYTILWNAFKRICESFSPKERSALFHDTAVKAYQLEGSNRAS
ncbi:MAG TPA: amidohydrolase family protein [Thermodesulfobacteriota bacterium]|nr:amidohydrolase family protein [Thermodesulfobacteriota bacterium]